MKPSAQVVYLAHPVSGDVAGNLERAKRWLLWVYRNYPDTAVVANWIVDCQILDDADPDHRALGLRHDLAIVERVDALWLVGGRVSGGMAIERDYATACNVPIVDLTFLGAEPPAGPAVRVPAGQDPDDQEFRP